MSWIILDRDSGSRYNSMVNPLWKSMVLYKFQVLGGVGNEDDLSTESKTAF